MKRAHSSRLMYFLPVVLVLVLLAAIGGVRAQDATPTPDGAAYIEFEGEVTEIIDTVIIVNGLTVQFSSAEITGLVAVGVRVRIEGALQPSGVILAQEITVLDVETTPEATPEATPETTPEATPEATPETTPEPDDDDTFEDVFDDDDVIIVIEGPVQSITNNIITIYNFDIEVNANDPTLTVLQIGDIVRVEGELDTDLDDDDVDDDVSVTQTNILIINVINITIINADVYVSDGGEVWRDDDCGSPPPPWAPAVGWRAKCEGGGGSFPGPGRGRGRGGSSS